MQIRKHGLTPLGEFDQGLVKLLHQREVALKLFDSGGQNDTKSEMSRPASIRIVTFQYFIKCWLEFTTHKKYILNISHRYSHTCLSVICGVLCILNMCNEHNIAQTYPDSDAAGISIYH